MKYLNEINKKSNAALYRYEIESTDEKILIKYAEIFMAEQGKTIPDEKMKIIQMHIANIPDLVSAIFMVFQSTNLDIWETTTLGDNLSVHMADNEREFLKIIISDKSRRVPQAFQNRIVFEFEDRINMSTPPPRIPTPSMIWVTDTLKQIYDDWKNQQSGGQGAQL